jgi:hypothetical protein
MKTLVMMRTRGLSGPMFQKIGPRIWVKGVGNFSGETISVHEDITFDYADETALLAAGWSWTADRDTRNLGLNITFQPLAMDCSAGSLKTNDASNMLFRALPADWTRLTLVYGNAGINENNESVRLCAYKDDDNYLEVARRFRGGRRFEGRVEVAGVSTDLPGPLQSGFDAGALRITNKGGGNYLGEYASLSMDDWTPIGDTNGAMSGAQDYDRIAVYTAEGPASPSSQLTPEFQRVIIEV